MKRHTCILLSFVVLFGLCGCSRAGGGASPGPASPAWKSIPAFDGDAAFNLLKKQVAFGPRTPGSDGHHSTADFIVSELRSTADGVSPQHFSTIVDDKTVNMENITAYFNPGAKKWVLLMAHWDTRPMADMEVNAVKKKQPIPGANDGASGVAVLLEMARVFAKQKPDVGVFMVFLDGEDYGETDTTMFLGARQFADTLPQSARVRGKPINFAYGILLDMVGDKDLNIYQEQNSVRAAPEVVNNIWSAAKAMGYSDKFVPRTKYSIGDDHIPLIRAGVKCVDIIDFDYGPWHTLDDTPDKCSPQSLKVVGDVVARVVYEEKAP